MRISSKCHDCGVVPGQKHREYCDVSRCLECGGQRLSCSCDGDEGDGDIWTGTWPGVAECEEYGLWCQNRCSEGLGFVPCSKDTPGVTEDLNALQVKTIWNKELQKRVLR